MVFKTYVNPVSGEIEPDGSVRNVRVDLPAGMVGIPTVAAECTLEQLLASSCPLDSQVGTLVAIDTNEGGLAPAGLFNMVPRPNAPAEFAYSYAGALVTIVPEVRPGDYGISSLSARTTQIENIYGVDVTLWGVPAAHSHDGERAGASPESPISSQATPRPFMRSPTSCTPGPQNPLIVADSWEHPEVSVSSSDAFDGTPFEFSGCDQLPFSPTIALHPSSQEVENPTGLDVSLKLPQSEDPNSPSTADLRKAKITLPKGMALSPAAANGLGACSEAQIGIGTNDPPTCPDSSKIGTVKIKTPLLSEELEGSVILAKQKENPFGSLLAMYLAVKGPGFYLKLPGKIEADPQTGQLTTTFDNNPQLPFNELNLDLTGGAQAVLVTPSACGRYDVHTELTSWASAVPLQIDTPITIDQGCATGGFAPKLNAGATNPAGGRFSPFTLQVTREDGEQNISRIEATLPEGLLAKLAGVPLCGDAQAATGDCPAASQIGTTTVGTGAGPLPVYVPQPGKAPTAVYLSGPYKGAPYSLVVKVPAQAGPFDLGTVAVRSAIAIDPVTTAVSVKSDPLPQILEGIPLSYRDVRVEVSRPDFTLNPTGCDPTKVESTIVSSGGKSASPSSRFQVGGCGELGFAPKLALALSGPTHRSAHPALKAVLTTRKGDANIGRAQVTLPKTEFLENAHIQTVCTRVQFAADACPAKSVYGYAKAWSPLLDKPIQGPVYLRSSSHELPDLVASLDGQIHVDLSGRIDAVKARIRNTFDFVPDAPVSKFVLTMQGGKKGLLVNNTELCRTTPRADVAFDGQNGKTAGSSPVVKADCGKGRKARKK